MSTKSGITASQQLLDSFKSFDVNTLVVKVSDDSTSLVPDDEFPQPSSSDKQTIFSTLNQYFENKHPNPAYIIVPTDQVGSTNSPRFAFISFIPDEAPIRQKMLYASTKNTLLQQLGSNHFGKSHVLNWSDLNELSHEHYQHDTQDLSQDDSSNALTTEEKMLKEINSLQALSLAESGAGGNDAFKKELASMHSHSSSPSVAAGSSSGGGTLLFEVEASLEQEFKELPDVGTSHKLITFNIDIPKEIVKLTSANSNVELSLLIDHLTKAVDTTTPHPQFAVYNYDANKVAFIYSCPSGSKVKDRMIYASNRQGLITFIKSFLSNSSVVADKVLEVGDLDELDLSELTSAHELAADESPSSSSGTPATNSTRQNLKFNKPKGPRRR